jgi:hypothetical protein
MPSSSGERKRPAGPKPMFSSEHTICAVDPEVWQAIKAENKRQHANILSSSPRRIMPVPR